MKGKVTMGKPIRIKELDKLLADPKNHKRCWSQDPIEVEGVLTTPEEIVEAYYPKMNTGVLAGWLSKLMGWEVREDVVRGIASRTGTRKHAGKGDVDGR